jgi:DNA mismatch endonuclease (patch repair protein)
VPDIVDAATRSRMMSGIRSKNTKPEILIRKALHRRGFRYRLHSPNVPGRPDMVFPKLRAVIFVNGCFWHGHDCPLYRLPSTKTEFWRNKIGRNIERDLEVRRKLSGCGWRHLTIWECAIRGPNKIGLKKAVDKCTRWLLLKTAPSRELRAPKPEMFG